MISISADPLWSWGLKTSYKLVCNVYLGYSYLAGEWRHTQIDKGLMQNNVFCEEKKSSVTELYGQPTSIFELKI